MAHFSVVSSVILVSLPVTFLLAAAIRGKNRRKATFPMSVEALISQGAVKAIARARSRYELTLDYTNESIRSVETILSYLHDTFVADPNVVDVNSMAFVLGSYVGETIRKNKPGSAWQPSFGSGNSYALRSGEESCFPMEWCMQRLTGSADENVWTKYRQFMHQQVVEEAPVRLKALSASAGGFKF